MTNPYEPPKTTQEPDLLRPDFFVRVQKYQYRGFYVGILMAIGGVILSSVTGQPIMADVSYVVMGIGVTLLFLSLGSILPMAIWGFVKGYRESRPK